MKIISLLIAPDNPPTDKLWDSIFPNRDPKFTRLSFLQAVTKFPGFCKASSNDAATSLLNDSQRCARELAAFFAHVLVETNGNAPERIDPKTG